MKAFQILFICSLMFMIAAPAVGTTGKEWEGLEQDPRTLYVAGAIEAWRHTVSLASTNPQSDTGSLMAKTYKSISPCPLDPNIAYARLRAIVEKYMDAHKD